MAQNTVFKRCHWSTRSPWAAEVQKPWLITVTWKFSSSGLLVSSYVSEHSSLLQIQMPHLSKSHGKWSVYFQWPPVKKLVWITTMEILCQEKIESCFLDWHPITLTILVLVVVLSHFLVHFFKILYQMNDLQYTVLIHPCSKAILCTVWGRCVLEMIDMSHAISLHAHSQDEGKFGYIGNLALLAPLFWIWSC